MSEERTCDVCCNPAGPPLEWTMMRLCELCATDSVRRESRILSALNLARTIDSPNQKAAIGRLIELLREVWIWRPYSSDGDVVAEALRPFGDWLDTDTIKEQN